MREISALNPRSYMVPSMRRRLLYFMAALVALGAACSGAERPDAGEWQGDWAGTVAVVRSATAMGADLDAETCEETVAYLRDVGENLEPTPEDVPSETIRMWLEQAKGIFFNCEPVGGDMATFEESVTKLDRLEAEVDAVLEITTTVP